MQALRVLIILWLLVFGGCVVGERMLTMQERSSRLQDAEDLLTRAVSLMRSGAEAELAEARACLELARELSPTDARIPDGLGCIAWHENDFAQAAYWFQAAVQIDPEYDRPYVHLALLAERQGDIQAARELLIMAMGLNPRDHHARNNYAALLLDNLGRDPKARREAHLEFLKSSQLTPDKRDPIIEHNLKLSARKAAR